jgi:hypothetical protein
VVYAVSHGACKQHLGYTRLQQSKYCRAKNGFSRGGITRYRWTSCGQPPHCRGRNAST